MHLLLNGTSLVIRDGAEDAHVRVYLTLVFCANSTSLTSSCSLAFILDEFPRLPILSKLISWLYHEVHKSLGPTETDESKPFTGLLGPQVYDGLV